MASRCAALPGAFSGLCARAVADAAFEACYISGAAVSASAGVPDIGLLGLEHFCRVIREAWDSSRLPIIADADVGFGEGEMAARAVWDYSRAGAAGLHIEDQVFPKRCGHLDGKALVPVDHMLEKIASAARAVNACSSGQFILCARTDARGVEGFDSAVARAKAYVDAGASMIFPEGLHTEDEFARFADALRQHPAPAARPAGGPFLLANMTEFGKTPIIPLSKFEKMGYSCVIFPVTTLRVAMGAVTRALAALRRDGHVESFLDQMQTRKDLYALLGYTPGVEWEFPNPRQRAR